MGDSPVKIYRLPRAARWPLCGLLFLCALPFAQAFEVYVAPALVFQDSSGYSERSDSQAQVFANVQAYWDGVAQQFPGRSYTVSNLHPEPTRPEYYTMNGVWTRHYSGVVSIPMGTCSGTL